MKRIKVYTLGGDNMEWRKQMQEICAQGDNLISFIHPPLHKAGFTDKEFEEWNRRQIFDSDVVIINVEEVDENNLYEIGVIDSINTFSNKHIFVIGIGKLGTQLKPYIKSAIFHHELIYEDAADYIRNFLSI